MTENVKPERRQWRASEMCPIVAPGQKRAIRDNDQGKSLDYTVIEKIDARTHRVLYLDPAGNECRPTWQNDAITLDPLTEDWTET